MVSQSLEEATGFLREREKWLFPIFMLWLLCPPLSPGPPPSCKPCFCFFPLLLETKTCVSKQHRGTGESRGWSVTGVLEQKTPATMESLEPFGRNQTDTSFGYLTVYSATRNIGITLMVLGLRSKAHVSWSTI